MKLFSRSTTEPEATGPTDVEPTPSEVERIKMKLAETAAELETAEVVLDQIALRAALEDDGSASEATTRLDDLRQRLNLMTRALAAAEVAERQAASRLSAREHATRRRSLSQRLGELSRNQAAVTASLAELRDNFRKLAGTGASIIALLPEQLRGSAVGFEPQLTASGLRMLCEVEACRLSDDGGVAAPGAERQIHVARNDDWQIDPMAKAMGKLANSLRSRFDDCGPIQPKAPEQPCGAEEVIA